MHSSLSRTKRESCVSGDIIPLMAPPWNKIVWQASGLLLQRWALFSLKIQHILISWGESYLTHHFETSHRWSLDWVPVTKKATRLIWVQSFLYSSQHLLKMKDLKHILWSVIQIYLFVSTDCAIHLSKLPTVTKLTTSVDRQVLNWLSYPKNNHCVYSNPPLCFLSFYSDSNPKPPNQEFTTPLGCWLPEGMCYSGLLEKSAYGQGKKVLSFHTVVTLNKCVQPALRWLHLMRLGRHRADCAHDVPCTVWQQTDFRPAAYGTDCKQTSEQWQSADLRPAERQISSCPLLVPKFQKSCCSTDCAHMHSHAHKHTHITVLAHS